MIVYLAQDIPAFVMYCINGESGSSLLIESTDSMIINGLGYWLYYSTHCAVSYACMHYFWDMECWAEPAALVLGQPRVGVISIINICRHISVCWFPCPPCWVAGNCLVNANVNAVIPQLFLLRSVSATDQ